MSLQTWVVLSLLVFSQLGLLAAQEEGGEVEGSNDDAAVNIDINIHTEETLSDVVTSTTVAVTTPVENLNTTTLNTTSVESSSPKSNTGAIVGAAVIAVTACFVVVLGVFLFKRRRQFRMQDKEKKMQIQMSSARNAGVYHDLTVSVPADDKPSASPEHEHLKATEDA
ncbi:hypothetical protein BsWGS_18237 [Bradybaena similaris]